MPIGSYIIATEPFAPDLARALAPTGRVFFDTKNFLYYWRLTPDDRMLFGGRAGFWPSSVERTARILQRGMVEVHPRLAGVRVDYAWGGRVAFTYDRMPHVGRFGAVTYATGCCGSGVAILPWLGERAADWIVGGGPAPTLTKLRFQLANGPMQRGHRLCHLGVGETRRDVLRTVPIERHNIDEDQSLDARRRHITGTSRDEIGPQLGILDSRAS